MAQGGLAGNAGLFTDGIVCWASLWVESAVQALQSPGWSVPNHSFTLLFTHVYWPFYWAL